MIDFGKKDVLGISIDAVDYEAAVERVITAAKEQRPLAVSALAVHGVMTGVLDPAHKFRLNKFDLLTVNRCVGPSAGCIKQSWPIVSMGRA
jgi:N-acetylglucosaminyldiphosphoundecaprenol N-acetyl-beta-D-mannosaminyltransferase